MLQNQPRCRRAMRFMRENVFPRSADPFEKRSLCYQWLARGAHTSEFRSAVDSRTSSPMPVEICASAPRLSGTHIFEHLDALTEPLEARVVLLLEIRCCALLLRT